MIELVDEYGPEEIMRYVEAILDYADRRTADEIRSMPDGKYYAEGYVDTDGAGNTDLKVAVTLNIDDDKIHADFTGSAPQGSGGTNGTGCHGSVCGNSNPLRNRCGNTT